MRTEDIINEQKSVGDMVPQVTFHTRVRDDSIEGPNPYTLKAKKSLCFHCQEHSPLLAQPCNCQALKKCQKTFMPKV